MTPEHVWARERLRLTALAYRITGSWHDAEEAAADAGAKLLTAHDVHSPEAWLRRVTVRAAIDLARRSERRKESYIGPWLPEPVATDALPQDTAEDRAMLGLGLLRIIQELTPVDRAVFVLREAFAVPYADIAACVELSDAACRQIVSRARRRLSGLDEPSGHAPQQLNDLVAAITSGDVTAAVRLISEDCVLWTDGGGTTKSALRPIVGADKVARFLIGTARKAGPLNPVPLRINGGVGVWVETPVGPRLLVIEQSGGRISGVQLHGNRAKLAHVAEPRP